ncbi:nuclear transport factor 2 family protein [Nordella sp. HKS 07]|uniref:nuclear transport factor 2 family protein n=1 Tax=Nordella sp. HKS 07 TaxID=2712222 RepID=UPI0013E11DBA|nr:nuclear transport factor 2 family protein [Nordella sp. HKS 07]QIG46489.1 nuclear transport factor 2 family protein [Nordella sp. HKS 07]
MPDQAVLLQEAVRQFGEAWASGDLRTLDALLSPTYSHSDAFGKLYDRAGWLAYAAARAGRGTQISFREVETRYIGDIAVVTGVNDLTGGGIRNAGDQTDLSIRFTQVWLLRDGKWLREAFQATPIQEDSNGA